MNEKYVQAIIIGAFIGASIVLTGLISQPKKSNMELHTLNLQKGMDLDIGDIEDIWIKDEDSSINLSTGDKQKKIIIKKEKSNKKSSGKERKYIVKIDSKNLNSNTDLSMKVDEIVDELFVDLSRNGNNPSKLELGKVISKALEGIDSKVCVEILNNS